MKGQYDNSQPIFRQIIDQFLQSITTGELVPGGKVAPVRELALEYNVNPNTMQRSLAKLEEMGYLFTERTSGRYVTHDQELIANLKTLLPAQITKKYIGDMQECGVPQDGILEFITDYMKGR